MHKLILTKLHKPHEAGTWVARPRLLEALNDGLSRKLILVDAPAGYGKTTLLAQWLNAQSLPSAWLSLDETDNDLGMFLSYVAQAVRTIQPDSMSTTAMLLSGAQMPPVDILASTLINELDALPYEIVLVLDDFHVIHSPEITQLMTRLVARPPSSLHLVLATRSDPPLPLAKLRARGELLEVRAAELRFSLDETRIFLRNEGQHVLNQDAVHTLEARTEGWPVGLRLAALSLKSTADPQAFIADFAASGSAGVMGFLANEVFTHLAAPLQDFLIRASVPNRFCASLCAALYDPDEEEHDVSGSAARLNEIEQQNLFLIPLDNSGEWFRFHHLFRDLLRNRLHARMSKTAIAGLHDRASDWLAAHGFEEEALHEARLSGDTDRVVRLVEANAHAILNREEWMTLSRWLSYVPDEILQRRPRLLIARAYLKVMRFELADVTLLVTQAEQLLRNGGLDMSASDSDAAQSEILGLRAQLYGSAGQQGVELAETALRLLPDGYRYARGLALMLVAVNMQMTGHRREAEARLRLATLRASAPDAFSVRIPYAQWFLARMEGEIAPSAALVERFLAASEEAGLMVSTCWAHTTAGERYHEINELERAIEHLDVVAMHVHQASFLCQTVARVQLALAQQAAGQPNLADATIQALRSYTRSAHSFSRWQMIDATEAHLRLLRGDLAGAMRWVRSSQPEPNVGALMLNEIPNLIRAQILIALRAPDALDEAMALLQGLHAMAVPWHNRYHSAKILAAQASALWAFNRREEALQSMEAAVEIGERGGLVRAFADLGADVLTVMRALAEQSATGSLRHDYLARVIAAFSSAPAAGISAAEDAAPTAPVTLTLRESEVLALLDRHRSDKEIAEALVLSRLTVSKHTANIYRKLGVSNRREAVAKARVLGMLSQA